MIIQLFITVQPATIITQIKNILIIHKFSMWWEQAQELCAWYENSKNCTKKLQIYAQCNLFPKFIAELLLRFIKCNNYFHLHYNSLSCSKYKCLISSIYATCSANPFPLHFIITVIKNTNYIASYHSVFKIPSYFHCLRSIYSNPYFALKLPQ